MLQLSGRSSFEGALADCDENLANGKGFTTLERLVGLLEPKESSHPCLSCSVVPQTRWRRAFISFFTRVYIFFSFRSLLGLPFLPTTSQYRGCCPKAHIESRVSSQIIAQGGDIEGFRGMMRDQPSTSKHSITIRSARGGYVTGIDSDAIGWCCVALGGGRSKADSPIDHNAAIMLTAKVGDAVEEGGTLAVVYTDVDDHSGSSSHSEPATIIIIPKTLFVMRCTDAGQASSAACQGILGSFGSLGFLGFRVGGVILNYLGWPRYRSTYL